MDIAARGIWDKGQMAYFDVRVFKPTAKFYLNSDLTTAHEINEQTKNDRITREFCQWTKVRSLLWYSHAMEI